MPVMQSYRLGCDAGDAITQVGLFVTYSDSETEI